MRVADIDSIRIRLASSDDILSWSRGEVTKPETINYRTQRAEKDGLFCEKIFGPEKDYECYCGKYRRIRYKGIVCDRCGVEVTKSSVRRERMGHIKLASPVSHIWFLKGVPSMLGTVIDLPAQQLERVIYFAAYIITNVNEEAKKKILDEIEKEYEQKIRAAKTNKTSPDYLDELRNVRNQAKDEVLNIKPLKIMSELEYHDMSLKFGEIFEAGTGAEVLKKIFEKMDFKKEIAESKEKAANSLLAKKNLKELEEDIHALSDEENTERESQTAGAEEGAVVEQKKLVRRLKILEVMQKARVRPEWMFLEVLPVLPPDLRPMVQLDGGRYASSDLNDLYRRVINRNNRLKYLLEIKAPDVIVRNEKRMLQEAVDALLDNEMRKSTMTVATTGGRRLLKSLADILKGKQGRFRQNLLGKRVDYSGRSVIVVGPELKLYQCGLPKKMALELFKPFVIRGILAKELAYNVRGASRLIEEEGDDVWAILEEVVKDKLVLLNRAPTLHRLGIQAFWPVLIEGEAIRVHPLVCKAFNADFDGDQMAVHLPLSEEAQKEAREIMLSTNNLLKPATGMPIVSPTQDIILGCYWLTRFNGEVVLSKGEGKQFGSTEEALLAYDHGQVDLKAKIKIRKNALKNVLESGYVAKKGKKKNKQEDSSAFVQDKTSQVNEFVETSVGRIIFNEILPEDFPFQNCDINSKKLEKIMNEIAENRSSEIIQQTLDKVKTLGFEYATRSGLSWGMDDLVVPTEKGQIVEKAEKEVEVIEGYYKKGLLSKEERSGKIIEVWIKAKAEIEKLVPIALSKEGTVSLIVDSGARGSWTQPVQMAGMKGLVINPAGQIIELPVKSSFKEGFDVLEYFISTHGARKGTADTALRTSTAGYLTRRLVDVAHEVIVTQEDCGDKDGIEILRRDADVLSQNFIFKIVGRMSVDDIKANGETIVKKGDFISWKAAEQIIEANIEKVRARSPLACRSARGLCRQCYGWDLGKNAVVELGQAVGVVAAQAIGEPGTQLTMRTFHTGGVAGGGDITMGLPRVQEIFEARIPGGKALASEVDGKIIEITSDKVIRIKIEGAAADVPKKNASRKNKKKTDIAEYAIPANMALWVQEGQLVVKGQQLCEGNLDLRELFKVKGKNDTQKYIVQEVQKIYSSQGATIHDKHIEVIVRQMFSRVRIKDPGDSSFSDKEIVERTIFMEENARLRQVGKKIATAHPVLLGISKVALTTDSFLSAASFQETSRVLIKAALEAKEDKLRGLKENVIIGKLIPAGTGFRRK